MIEFILNELKNKGINEYIINKSNKEAVELFFIKKDLEMSRKKTIEEYTLQVFRVIEDGVNKYKGDASVKIYSSMDRDEISSAIDEAYFAAAFIKNKDYYIPKGENCGKILQNNMLSGQSLENTALKIKEALFENDNYTKGWINSAEVFVEKINKRIISSSGTDVSYENYSVSGEFITQWVENQDVEIYNSFKYHNLAEAELAEKVKEALENTSLRDKAEGKLSTGKYNLILSDDDVREVFKYYIDNSKVSMIYDKYSDFQIGKSIQGEEVQGDKINITLTASEPVDSIGLRLENKELVKDGVLSTFHGNYKYSEYLGLKPFGEYNGAIINCGNTSFSEMMNEGDIHVIRFSAFQMNSFTGNFAGEIRLGVIKRNGILVPFTGGSVMVNIKDVQQNMILSKEVYKNGSYITPKAIKMLNIQFLGNN